MELIFSLPQLEETAQRILDAKPEKVILLTGDMGAGKTTFVKAFARALGVADTKGSPNFPLVQEYRTAEGDKSYPFDMYRIKSEAEAYDMGMDEYLYSGDWCLIEWPEKIPSLLPDQYSSITITVMFDGQRIIRFQ